jgi:hypothetical protein
VLPTDELMAQRRRHRDLVEASVRIMAEAHDFLSESGTIMILTDPSGVILQTEGDPGTLEVASEPRLVIGANWSETDCGTNAIGTALDRAAAQVHAGISAKGQAVDLLSPVVQRPASRRSWCSISRDSKEPRPVVWPWCGGGRPNGRLAGAREMTATLAVRVRTDVGGLRRPELLRPRGSLIKADARGASLVAMGSSQSAGKIRIDASGADEDAPATARFPAWLRAG